MPFVWLDLWNNGKEGVLIESLYVVTPQRGKGHAGRVLSALCAAADRMGITLRLAARAYGCERKRTLVTNADLVNWYARYGFIARPSPLSEDRVFMVRRPSRRPALAA